MLKRNFGILLLVTCFILITIPNVLGATVDLYPTGNNDQNQINAAISQASSGATPSNHGQVFLEAGTFDIKAPIILMSNVDLIGMYDPNGNGPFIYGD